MGRLAGQLMVRSRSAMWGACYSVCTSHSTTIKMEKLASSTSQHLSGNRIDQRRHGMTLLISSFSRPATWKWRGFFPRSGCNTKFPKAKEHTRAIGLIGGRVTNVHTAWSISADQTLVARILSRCSQYCEKRILAFVTSVCPSAWNSQAPNERILLEFDIWAFFENMWRKFKFH